MTTPIREKARALQAQHYTGDQAESPAAVLAARLYDEIDALSAAQRGLLVTQSAGYTKGVLQNILAAHSLAEIKAMALIGLGLLGATCYANESNREDSGDTTVADRMVDEALETVREMTSEQTAELLPADQRALADEINSKVEARVNAGEDPGRALAAELATYRDRIEALVGKDEDDDSPSSTPVRYDDSGMYL